MGTDVSGCVPCPDSGTVWWSTTVVVVTRWVKNLLTTCQGEVSIPMVGFKSLALQFFFFFRCTNIIPKHSCKRNNLPSCHQCHSQAFACSHCAHTALTLPRRSHSVSWHFLNSLQDRFNALKVCNEVVEEDSNLK
jgi:hypothetical protein